MALDSKIDICKRALVLIGEAPISSFDDGSAAATVAGNLYDATKRHMIAGYPWRFAAMGTTINKIVTTKDTDYDGAYQLPAQCLRVQRVRYAGSVLTPFEIFGQELHIDSTYDTLELDYIKLVDEDAMAEWFVEALQYRLASMFAASITQSASMASYWENEAEKALRRARFSDSLIDSPNTIEPTRLITLRR
jgi:hypothetical protein